MMATSDDSKTPDKPAEPRKATPQSARTTENSRRGTVGSDSGVRQQVTADHEARVTVPGADQVDARLDNRTGADRPPLEQWPAKPQQIDGPDVAHQAEHTRRVLADRDLEAETGERKGMFSPGPHGLSDETLREGGPKGEEETLYGTESLTESEVADGAPKADR